VLNGTDIEAIKDATEKLLTTSQGFSHACTKRPQGELLGAVGPAGQRRRLVDAEIVD